jgi:histidinol dehydrogenase
MEIVAYKPNASNAALERIRSRTLQMNPDLVARVAEIIEGVRAGGDEALIHYTEKFDGVTLRPGEIRVTADFIKEMAARADARAVEAFRQAIANVRAFHEHQIEADWRISLADGATVGQRIRPVTAAGLYVPGGRAAYPSSVMMNTIPAQVAGVRRVCITTPPGTLERVPAVAAVIQELGVSEVYRVGGAQAVAALAFGTESIARVDKVVGPGNVYVAIAKKLVYGAVGIDSIAGPTEVVVIADETAPARFVAADLLAQAEHDAEASAVCITTSAGLARDVAREVERQLESLERRDIARASINAYGAIFVVDSLKAACDLSNKIAPEHLELMTADNESAAQLIENAGAIFFGAYSSEPIGDYFAGPNQVLPTVGTARFSSPLGVYDFLKRQSVIHYSRDAVERAAAAIAAMADSEGLTAHKRAVLVRVGAGGQEPEAGEGSNPDPITRRENGE